MTKDKKYYYQKTEYRRRSGKKCQSTPGQFRLDNIDADLKEIIVRARQSVREENKKPSCTPEQAKEYWKAFQKFLEFSGSFTRTWHLYSQIKDDSDVSFLSGQLLRGDLSEVEKAEYDDKLRRALNHQDSMKIQQGCNTLDELSMKASKDWQEYRKTFNRLLECSKEVGFSFELSEDEKDGIMLHFVILDDKVRGNCRREFYKERYVQKAMKAIVQTGFFQPVSIEEIEKAFQADKAYQKLFYRKRKR